MKGNIGEAIPGVPHLAPMQRAVYVAHESINRLVAFHFSRSCCSLSSRWPFPDTDATVVPRPSAFRIVVALVALVAAHHLNMNMLGIFHRGAQHFRLPALKNIVLDTCQTAVPETTKRCFVGVAKLCDAHAVRETVESGSVMGDGEVLPDLRGISPSQASIFRRPLGTEMMDRLLGIAGKGGDKRGGKLAAQHDIPKAWVDQIATLEFLSLGPKWYS